MSRRDICGRRTASLQLLNLVVLVSEAQRRGVRKKEGKRSAVQLKALLPTARLGGPRRPVLVPRRFASHLPPNIFEAFYSATMRLDLTDGFRLALNLGV